MRKTTVSSTLTVCFDGQFWVGMIEHAEDGGLSACRVVFGAEPSNEEVLDFVLKEWGRFPFGEPVACDAPKMARNPKRRQREAAHEMRRRGPSTKAQLALANQQDALAREKQAAQKRLREDKRRQRFELSCAKRKRKRRGH